MDCFFHHAVPSVALCSGCRKPVCASCRSEQGDCPSCRMAAKIDGARRAAMLEGGIGPSSAGAQHAPPPPPYEPAPQYAPPQRRRSAAALAVRPETRAIVALSYPLWPLALLALLDSRGSHFVRRQAWQALGFNFGIYGFGAVLGMIASLPIIGWSAWPLLPFIPVVAVVASVLYAFRVWNGEDVDVPIVSDWVDARLPA